tara:strand:- start:1069 stop:2424 length:1356 start_codon:yes stop_codon:yes gene_type:complete
MIKLKDIITEQDRINESSRKVNTNVKKLLEEKNNNILNEDNSWVDNLQTILDYIGIIPVIGDIIDVINAIIYFIRGKWFDGILAIIAVIPVVGSAISLPLKAIFKVLGPVLVKFGSKLSKLISKGSGKECAKDFIEMCLQNGAGEQLDAFIIIFKQYSSDITKYFNKIQKKFDSLHNFSHWAVADALEPSIRSLGKYCSNATEGLNKFFKNLEPEYKAIKSRYPDINSSWDAVKGRPKSNLVKQTDIDGDEVFSKYASKNGSDDIFAFSTKAATDKNFILFKRSYNKGVPTNKFSMKTAVEKPGMFKNGMKELSKRMPNHKFFEETSISSDGLDMWKKQLDKGYKASEETFTVPINIAGTKTKLPGTQKGKQFDQAYFSNLDDAQVSLDIIKDKIKDIPNASVKMMKKGPVKWELKVTLPVLQSTPKSVNYWSKIPAKSFRFYKPDNEDAK